MICNNKSGSELPLMVLLLIIFNNIGATTARWVHDFGFGQVEI